MSCTKQQKKNTSHSPRMGRRCEAKQVEHRKSLQSVLNGLLPDDGIFANCKFHGNVRWKPKQLVAQALCWSGQETKNVTTAFDHCLEVCEALGAQKSAQTYPTFMTALGRYQGSLGTCLNHDAGFVGYPLWSSILAAGGNFLIRVGGNVSLLGKQADFKRDKDGIV
jgi:hypothetical protein